MKMLRKVTVFALIIAMMISLAACGSSGDQKALVGQWKGRIEATEQVNEAVWADMEEDMKQYIGFSSFYIPLIFTFNDDDTYTLQLDKAELNAVLNVIKEELKVGLEAYFADYIASMGIEITVEELLSLSGTSMDALIDEAFSDELMEGLIQDMVSSLEGSGEYKAVDGTLTMTNYAGLDENKETYTLEGDLFILTTQTDDEVAYAMYPMVFKRAG